MEHGNQAYELAVPTILLVDDAPSNLELLKGVLKTSGHHLVAAGDGRAALRMIAENPPDLILLDVMMPGIDGFTVCREVKSDARTHRIPIILLTALNEVDDYVKGIECGADDFISKPFNPQVLLARVRCYVQAKLLADELDRQKEFRHDLMRMLAHDLNNHMAAVLGYLDLVLGHSGIPSNDIVKIERAQCSAEEAAKLLRNFMSLEKSEAGTLAISCKELDLCEPLRRAIQMKDVVFQRKTIDVLIDAPASSTCAFDPDLTDRIIHNLLDNAAKYATENSSIRVEVKSVRNCLEFAISNRGPIIPADDIDHVFDRFYQVKSNDLPQARGTGLGLAFCKMAVEAQGGTINIVSPPQGEPDGVKVTVSFPGRLGPIHAGRSREYMVGPELART